MINYRIDDMDEMIAQLKNASIEILKVPEFHENGKFAWIMDPEGNKVELWEPKIWDEKKQEAVGKRAVGIKTISFRNLSIWIF